MSHSNTAASSTNFDPYSPSSQLQKDDNRVVDLHIEMLHSPHYQSQEDVDQVEESCRHEGIVISAVPEYDASLGSPEQEKYSDSVNAWIEEVKGHFHHP